MQFLETNAQRVVIKIGTHSIAAPDGQLRMDRIRELCRQIASLKSKGMQVLVISSGAVGMGVSTLRMDSRPSDLATLQACAAVGQSQLVEAWQKALAELGLTAAQILLTREDIRGRKRHLAARNTIEKLLSIGVVPVVNENDTVSADEIKFGDNDILSALLASLVKADLLVILSTISGLMENQGKGALIPIVQEITEEISAMAGGSSSAHATGGMVTKIEAAKLATQSGCGVFIGAADSPNILDEIHLGTAKGTFFVPQKIPLASRKRWIAYFQKPMGQLIVDAGAARALVDRNSSLLAKGVLSSVGTFSEGDIITIHDEAGKIIARGMISFGNSDLKQIIGKNTDEIRTLFAEKSRCEVVHKDSLVLI